MWAMRSKWGWCLAWAVLTTARAQVAQNPFECQAAATRGNEIDRLVFTRLEQLGIPPANLCSDAVFVRRVYLDVIGTVPTATQAREFILDQNPNKRRALIDRLLERDEYAHYWAMKWSDVLRVKAEFPINLWPNAAQAYHRWIRTSLKENIPYDEFARGLLTSNGSNFRVGPVNFYRAMQSRDSQGIAQTVALTVMGTRADKWPTNQLAGMAAFFSQVGYKCTSEWKEEIVYWNPAATNAQSAGILPGGKKVGFNGDRDPREIFADWLIDGKNPWFARNLVNRVWAWLLGRGIIQEPDDIRPDNPPNNPELLALLERECVASKYDLKQLYRLILNSQTYQLGSIPSSDRPEVAANFAAYPLRRLDAEVLIDALNQITSTTEKYSSPIPEPFTFIPEEQRSIALPDGSITSPFLEMFGRSPRDTGLESERNNRITDAQRLHLLNSSQVQRKINQSRMLQYQLQGNKSAREIVTAMYLGILSRFPTDDEVNTAEAYAKSVPSKREATTDLAWALINSAEFLYRH
jgi:hypothetical protein